MYILSVKKCPHSKLTVCTFNRPCIAPTFISTSSYVALLAKQALSKSQKYMYGYVLSLELLFELHNIFHEVSKKEAKNSEKLKT